MNTDKYYYCYTQGEGNGILTYSTFWGKVKNIPLILVEHEDENGREVFEFFTKTHFDFVTSGYSITISLPNSTLVFYPFASMGNTYTGITPVEALQKLDPHLKRASKCAEQIESYFRFFRDDFARKQQAQREREKANESAQEVLSRFWSKR